MLTTACTTVPKVAKTPTPVVEEKIPYPPVLDGSFFGDEIEIIENSEVYDLTEEQKNDFLEHFHDRKNRTINPHKRVYEFLESRLDSFDYYSDTSNASESLKQNKGNCLSLAILTKSLADLADIDIDYQLVETEPVFQKEGNLLVSSQHIRTVLFDPIAVKPGNFSFSISRIIIDYFPTYNSRILRKVEEDEFFSMYYSNKATEALLQNNINQSYWYLRKALELKPNDSNAINIMAVIHERAGYADYAEELYLFGIRYAKSKISQEQQYLDLLNNYHALLKRQNRDEDAALIEKRIGRRQVPNPFKWISMGNTAYNNRDFSKALSYYRKASKLAPYLHEAHAGIARAQFEMGHRKSAKQSLEKALKNSHKNNIRDMYQKKIEMLRQLINNKTPVIINSEH